MEILCFLSGAGGTVVFELHDGSAWDELGRTTVPYSGPGGSNNAALDRPGFPLGTYEIRARLLPSDYASPSEQTITYTMSKAPTDPSVEGPATVQAHHPVEIDAMVHPPSTGVQLTGNMTLSDADTNTVLAVGPPSLVYDFASLPLGVHHFVGSYEGDGNFEAGTGSLTVTVVPDIVEATSVGVSPASFYPFKDGYLDTASIGGTRNEPATVAITIYSPKGSVVRRASIALGTGRYAFGWNGRTTSVAVAPAGKYKVVQKLTDAFGSTKVVTSYVTISAKRLYSHTSTITKTVRQKYKSTSSWIGWAFTLPSATVYSKLTLSAYGESIPFVQSLGIRLGGWDFRLCRASAAWNPLCAGRSVALHSPGMGWASIGLSPTYNRSGHTVRAFVFATPGGSGKVSTVRLKVTYALLK